MWTLSGRLNRISGFGNINGTAYESNATRADTAGWIVGGNSYSSVVKVRRDSVDAFFDGKLVSHWTTDFSDMSLPDYVRLRQNDTLGLAFWGSNLIIEAAEVIEFHRDDRHGR